MIMINKWQTHGLLVETTFFLITWISIRELCPSLPRTPGAIRIKGCGCILGGFSELLFPAHFLTLSFSFNQTETISTRMTLTHDTMELLSPPGGRENQNESHPPLSKRRKKEAVDRTRATRACDRCKQYQYLSLSFGYCC
jgi:hypothetical protein